MKRYVKGITLIEMITILAVLGLAIPTLMLMWQNLAYHSGRSEAIAQATFYAQELMEEIKSKDYDDVDDFYDYIDYCNNQGLCDDDSARPYQRWVTINYVTLNATIWEGSANPTDFKQVTVSISHQFIADSDLVTTIVSRH